MKFKIILFALLIVVSVVSGQAKTFYSDGPRNIKKVALTFDDGPGGATEAVLKILEEKNVKATFFLLGFRAEKSPNLVKMIVAGGHEVANHTMLHTNFYKYEGDLATKIKSDLMRSDAIIHKITGKKPNLVRYPHGYCKPVSIEVAKENGYKVINWSYGADWKNISAQDLHAGYLKALNGGVIYLMHDAAKNAKILQFLPQLIDEIQAKGYQIVTVSQLLGFEKEPINTETSTTTATEVQTTTTTSPEKTLVKYNSKKA